MIFINVSLQGHYNVYLVSVQPYRHCLLWSNSRSATREAACTLSSVSGSVPATNRDAFAAVVEWPIGGLTGTVADAIQDVFSILLSHMFPAKARDMGVLLISLTLATARAEGDVMAALGGRPIDEAAPSSAWKPVAFPVRA
jgi:hypothetical protein